MSPFSTPSPDGRPRLFAMVSTLKSRDYTPHALHSFFDTTGLRSSDNFILINNDDPAIEQIAQPYNDRISLTNNPSPQSFAANVNSMIARALEEKMDLFFMNNDIIFTDNWLAPLVGHEHSILSPVSNREVQYAGSTIVTKTKEVANLVVGQFIVDCGSRLA